MTHSRTAKAFLCLLFAACSPADERASAASSGSAPAPPRSAADSQAAHVRDVVKAGGVVDSILPIGEHLRRFRASVPVRPDTLRHGSPSARALVDRWAAAVSARDTSAMNAMLLDRAEFAWLYYPDATMAKPPYEAPPELLWGQLLASSNAGAEKLFERFGGAPLTVRSVDCRNASAEGDNRLYESCNVRLVSRGASVPPNRYFGTIIERGGRYKFLGYANRL